MSKDFSKLPKLVPKTEKLFLASLICTSFAGCCTLGYDSMMMAGLISIDQFTSYITVNSAGTGLLNAGTWTGQCVSAFFITWLADTYGRKKSIFIANCLVFVAIAIQTAAQNTGMFVLGRFLLGIGVNIACSSGPVLVAELAPPKKRGWLVGLYFTMFNAGSIIASAVTYRTFKISGTWAWRLPSILQVVPSAFVMIMLLFVPESPRWMILKYNDVEYARQAFSICEPDEKAVEELTNEIYSSIMYEKETSHNAWKEITSFSRPIIKRFFICITLVWIVEMGGSSVGSYYLTILLEQAGITDTTKKLQINMISSCWNFAVAFAASFCFDKLGRRIQALIAICGMIVSFICLGCFIKNFSGNGNKSTQYATIFWMFLFNGFYSFCYTPITDIYCTELWPTRIRVAGLSIVRFFDSGFGLLASFVLPLAMNSVGWKFYIINACYDILFIPIILFVWIETKNLTLEEIAEKIGDVNCHDIEAVEQLSGTDSDGGADASKTEKEVIIGQKSL